MTGWRNKIYYRFKPWFPLSLRFALRRINAKRIREKCSDTWPIDESLATPPVGWSKWPEPSEFAFVLTHDVESPKGLEKVQELAEIEMERGFRSSFNFIPEGDYRVSQGLIDWLKENGFEVGIHDLHHDGKLYESRSGFSEKARAINVYLEKWGAEGFRSGFMLHNLDWLRELNVEYDASTFDTDPFEPQPDGLNTIFPLWIETMVETGDGYMELPYTLPQDSTLFLLLREQSIEIWKKKLDWIVRKGGMALVNVHPDYIDFGDKGDSKAHYPLEHYLELLDFVKNQYNQSAWCALPRDVARYCKAMSEQLQS